MRVAFVRPKEVVDVVAGIVGLFFDRFDGKQPVVVGAQAEAETGADDLTTIRGIGPAIARRLAEAGVATYAQLAALTAEEVRDCARLAAWQGHPEDWISQATAMIAH
jgi:predicted flap endonuclease-1-like 5' DNA nuclease